MKKQFIFLLSILLVLTLNACSNNQPEEDKPPEDGKQAILPIDLFEERYNVFSSVDFPQQYTIDQAEYVNGEYDLYSLHMTAQEDAEHIVQYFSELLGDDASESIEQNLHYLHTEGTVFIHGEQTNTGLSASCEIKHTQEDTGEYSIQLFTKIEDTTIYDEFVLANYNLNILSDVANYFDVIPFSEVNCKVNASSNNVQIDCTYPIENMIQLKNDMIAGFPDNYNTDEDTIQLEYGDIRSKLFFNEGNSSVTISQSFNDLHTNIKMYTPTLNLKNLGFNDYRNESAKCMFKADDYWISISKPAWGDNGNKGEINAVTFYKSINENAVFVFIHPQDNTYSIILENEEEQEAYTYDAISGEYTGENLDNAKQLAEKIFNKPDTESILQDAWVTAEEQIRQDFAMSTDELFDLAYE